MTRTKLLLLAGALTLWPALAQEERRDEELLAIRVGRVITVTGEEHAPGVVVVRDGRIEAVGARVEVPRRARVIDAPDAVLMPGLVNPRTRLGLPRYQRQGNHADLSAKDELLPQPGRFEGALEGGFVALGVVPAGTGVPGQAVVVRPLDDAPALGPGYVRARLVDLPGEKRTLRDAFRAAQAAIDKEDKAREEWEKKQKAAQQAAQQQTAQAQQQQPAQGQPPRPAQGPQQPPPQGQQPPAPGQQPPAQGQAPRPQASTAPVTTATFVPPPIPPGLQPFVAWLRKAPDAPRLLVELGSASGWVHLRDLGQQVKLPPATLFVSNAGQTDWHRVVAEVAADKPLVLAFPRVSFEAYTRTRVHIPAALARAGARVAFVPLVDDAEGHRRHLEAAALAHRDGMPRDEVLKALTLHPAQALGLEAELGAIEKGRRADLILLDGDPLEVGTRVTAVLLDGRIAWEVSR